MRVYQTDFSSREYKEAMVGANTMTGKGSGLGDDIRAKLVASYEEHRFHGSSMEVRTVVCVGRMGS